MRGEMDCFASRAMTVQHLNCLCCLKLDCRHCEERSDEAIHSFFTRPAGLLRGACHRARIRATRWLAMTAQHLDCLWLCEIRLPSLRGAERRSNPFFLYAARWIASRSPSSGAHLRDPLARNDGSTPELSLLFEIRLPSLLGAKRRSNPF